LRYKIMIAVAIDWMAHPETPDLQVPVTMYYKMAAVAVTDLDWSAAVTLLGGIDPGSFPLVVPSAYPDQFTLTVEGAE
jgi:hypothetical protein